MVRIEGIHEYSPRTDPLSGVMGGYREATGEYPAYRVAIARTGVYSGIG